jgi:hypothetical protein
MKEVEYEGPPMDEARPESIERSKGSPVAPTLRTLQIDANEESKKTTKLGILMAQRARNEAAGRPRILEETGHIEHHLGRIIFVLLLVLAFGIGVGMYALIGGRDSKPLIPESDGAMETMRTTESTATIAIERSSREQILATIAEKFNAAKIVSGTTQYITLTTTDQGGGHVSATTSTIFSAFDLIVHSETGNLVRSLDGTAIYGLYASENTGDLSGFLELRSRSYPETFAGMLRWEKAMADDLIPLLKPMMKKNDIVFFRGRTWSDERIENVPARVLNGPDGIAALAYAFLPDRKTLIIAGGQETLRALIKQSQNAGK